MKELGLVAYPRKCPRTIQDKAENRKIWGVSNLPRLWWRPATFSVCFIVELYYMQHKILAMFPDFAVAGAWLKTSMKCWSIQQNAGDVATIITCTVFQ